MRCHQKLKLLCSRAVVAECGHVAKKSLRFNGALLTSLTQFLEERVGKIPKEGTPKGPGDGLAVEPPKSCAKLARKHAQVAGQI